MVFKGAFDLLPNDCSTYSIILSEIDKSEVANFIVQTFKTQKSPFSNSETFHRLEKSNTYTYTAAFELADTTT